MNGRLPFAVYHSKPFGKWFQIQLTILTLPGDHCRRTGRCYTDDDDASIPAIFIISRAFSDAVLWREATEFLSQCTRSLNRLIHFQMEFLGFQMACHSPAWSTPSRIAIEWSLSRISTDHCRRGHLLDNHSSQLVESSTFNQVFSRQNRSLSILIPF